MGMIINPYRFGAYSGTLLDGLTGWWPLDETSGTRVNVHNPGTYDMADTNTVTSTTGKVGNAAKFTAANSERLDAPITYDKYQSYTLAYWFYNANVNATQFFVDINTNFDQYTQTDLLRNRISGVTETLAISNDTWYCVIFDFVQGVAANWYANDSLIGGSTGFDGAAWVSLRLGARRSLASAFNNDRMDNVALWTRVLTADERSEFYNSGSGMAYPG